MVRQPEFPAASRALIVMELDPTNSGTVMDQFEVPVAVPEPPKLFAQPTDVTPTLSDAVPLMGIAARVVAKVVPAGDVMTREGAVVSADEPVTVVRVMFSI